MPDDDRVVANEDVLDDEAHDSLALQDVKCVGGAAQARIRPLGRSGAFSCTKSAAAVVTALAGGLHGLGCADRHHGLAFAASYAATKRGDTRRKRSKSICPERVM